MTGKDHNQIGNDPSDDEFAASPQGEGPLAPDPAAPDQPRPSPEQDAAIQARSATMAAGKPAPGHEAAPGESPARTAAPLAPLRPPAAWLVNTPKQSAKAAVTTAARPAIPPLAPRARRWQQRWRMPLALAAGVTAIWLALPLWQQDDARQAPAATVPDTTLPPPPPLEPAPTPEASAAPAAPPPTPIASITPPRGANADNGAVKPRDTVNARKKAIAANEARSAQKAREKARQKAREKARIAAKASGRLATPVPVAPGTPAQIASAKATLANIENLLNQDQRVEALAELKKFRAAHPGYRVPDAISEQLRAPSE